jgi:thymidylate synthase (FAD)
MTVELIHVTPDAEFHIGLMASECYDSKTDAESCIKRAAHCNTSGHLATLRFAYATFRVSDISRVCSHQIVRMAHAGILQRSQRYVKETQVQYIDPPSLGGVDVSLQRQWREIQEAAEALYLRLVDSGQMKKEDARYILPQGCSTSMVLCLNFQGWRDFLENRLPMHAQHEVRQVAIEINRLLGEAAPNLFGDSL